MNLWKWSDDSNVEPRLTQPGSICYLDEKKLCLFAILTTTRDEFHELETIWSSVVSPESGDQTGKYQVSMDSTTSKNGQWVRNMPVPHKWTWYSLNYVSNVTIARTRTLLSLSWILLWNVSGWLWPLSRMTWTLFVIAWLLKRKFWGFNLTISSHSML